MGKSLYCLLAAVLFIQLNIACKKDAAVETLREEPETAPPVFKPVMQQVNDAIGGFYEATPSRYNETTKRYPLLLFVHGGGQFGNGSYDLPLLLNEGIPQLLDEKKFPAGFMSDGKQYSFVVLMPQFNRVPDNNVVSSFLEYAKRNYRIDTTRLYMCGFSLGARIACDFSASFPNMLAALVPISGVSNIQVTDKARNIANAGLPVWAFHNERDVLFNAQETKDFIAQINGFETAKRSKVTLFPDSTGMLGHDAWSRATNPLYKENNLNIYEWMLQYKR